MVLAALPLLLLLMTYGWMAESLHRSRFENQKSLIVFLYMEWFSTRYVLRLSNTKRAVIRPHPSSLVPLTSDDRESILRLLRPIFELDLDLTVYPFPQIYILCIEWYPNYSRKAYSSSSSNSTICSSMYSIIATATARTTIVIL